jgi:hypothetical protein
MNNCIEQFEILKTEFPEISLGAPYRSEGKCGGGCCDEIHSGYYIVWNNDEVLRFGWLNLEETKTYYSKKDYSYWIDRCRSLFMRIRTDQTKGHKL